MNKYIRKQIFSKRYYNEIDPLYWWYHPYMYKSPSLFLPSFITDVPIVFELSSSSNPSSIARPSLPPHS